ncbi:nucleoside deaminase [Gordonia sp. MMO-8]|uniref:nucleoside deaminase n=1 Tax=Gordonia sp. MMO-8 TaxID=3127886 RepID=UPI003FA5543D
MTLTPTDVAHLRRCVELAREAVDAGDEAFGSLLVNADGDIVFEDRNRVSGGDSTRHPELTLVEWAVANMTPEQRVASVTYTSGEHCAMCAAAHAWVGLGRIVYAGSTAQLTGWRAEWNLPASPVAPLSIREVAPGVAVTGPISEFAADLRALHARAAGVTL